MNNIDELLDPKNIERFAKEFAKKISEKKQVLNTMTEKEFVNFIEILKNSEEGCLDKEDIGYNPLENFNDDDFDRIWNYLEFKYNLNFDDPNNDYTHDFPESRIFFQYKDVKFIMRLLIGQGSCLQFWIQFWSKESNDWPPEGNPMVFDDSKKIIINF